MRVQDDADAPAADEGLSLPLAGFTVVRDEARKASGLLSVQRAYFGQEGEDQRRSDRTETGD